MKQSKRIISSLMVLVMALTLAFVPNTASAKALTAKQILTKSAQASAKVKSYEGTMNLNLNMKASGQNLKLAAKCNMVNFINPLKAKMVMTVDTGILGKMDFTTYTVQDKDNIIAYMLIGDTWYKQTIPAEESSQSVAPDTLTSIINNAYKAFKVTSTKGNSYSLSGSISGKMIKTVIDQANAGDLLTQIDPTFDSSIYDTDSKVTVKISVDKKTMLPTSYSIDMTDYFSSIVKNMKDSGVSNVSKYTMTCKFKNYNKAKDFSIPAAAKKALELSEIQL